jgi:hypothetical protein
MLTYADVFRRSLIFATVLFTADLFVALLPISTRIDFSFAGVVGDLLLTEVAVLFLAAGVLDFSSSFAMTAFRKLLSSNVDRSLDRRKESERNALVFLMAGLLLLVVLSSLSIYDHATMPR